VPPPLPGIERDVGVNLDPTFLNSLMLFYAN